MLQVVDLTQALITVVGTLVPVLLSLITLAYWLGGKFASIDERFARIDERFKSIDERFEEVNKRFEEVKEYVDYKFEEIKTYVDSRINSWLKLVELTRSSS